MRSFFFTKHSLQKLLLPFSPVQVVHTVNLSCHKLYLLISLYLPISHTILHSQGLEVPVASFPSFLSSLTLWPFLFTVFLPQTHSLLLPLSPFLSLYISLALSVSLSLPIVEGAHEL